MKKRIAYALLFIILLILCFMCYYYGKREGRDARRRLMPAVSIHYQVPLVKGVYWLF